MARTLRIGVAAVIIAFCFRGMFHQLALMRLDRSIRHLERVSGRLFLLADQREARILARSGAARVEALLDRFGTDPDLHMIAALNYRTLGSPGKAARHYEAALTTDYRPEILLNLGTVQLESGMRKEAAATFAEILDYDPWYSQYFPPAAFEPAAID